MGLLSSSSMRQPQELTPYRHVVIPHPLKERSAQQCHSDFPPLTSNISVQSTQIRGGLQLLLCPQTTTKVHSDLTPAPVLAAQCHA
eukprot:665281-Pelagomonas_calceolata.AAC.4